MKAPKIHATTQSFLVVLAEFDRLRGWERSGQSSCAHWLARYCEFDLGTAREKVRAARALAELRACGRRWAGVSFPSPRSAV